MKFNYGKDAKADYANYNVMDTDYENYTISKFFSILTLTPGRQSSGSTKKITLFKK